MTNYFVIGICWTAFAWVLQWHRTQAMHGLDAWVFVLGNVLFWPLAVAVAAWKEFGK